jgi:hypothetical protein
MPQAVSLVHARSTACNSSCVATWTSPTSRTQMLPRCICVLKKGLVEPHLVDPPAPSYNCCMHLWTSTWFISFRPHPPRATGRLAAGGDRVDGQWGLLAAAGLGRPIHILDRMVNQASTRPRVPSQNWPASRGRLQANRGTKPCCRTCGTGMLVNTAGPGHSMDRKLRNMVHCNGLPWWGIHAGDIRIHSCGLHVLG